MEPRPILVAVAGGSGSGKTWLSRQLQEVLELPVTRLSLDDFYRDQSHVPRSVRDRINFDHPEAIDWALAWRVLRSCRAGLSVLTPRYSFVTHTRRRTYKTVKPQPIILMDGLWLWWRPSLQRLFDFRIFLHCPERLRLARRLERDTAARGRDDKSVRRQFQETVAPMHKQFVEPQVEGADIVLRSPVGRRDVERLAGIIRDKAHV